MANSGFPKDETGLVTAQNVFSSRGIEARIANEQTLYHIKDAHGDVIGLWDEFNNPLDSIAYDPYGNQLSPELSVWDGNMLQVLQRKEEGVSSPFGYCGEYTDAETGFVYLRARYYDTQVGRFTQEDTHWNPGNMIYGDDGNGSIPSAAAIMQSSNLYVYAVNNSIRWVDPSGYVIKLSSAATDAQKREYERAIKYLKTSATGKALIKKLEDAKETITITFNKKHNDVYTIETRTIAWDPTSRLVLGDGKSVQSAALGLVHEMGHAGQHLDGTYFSFASYEDREADNLKNCETPIATELGEFTRKNYDDVSKTLRILHSTVWGSIPSGNAIKRGAYWARRAVECMPK